MLVLLLLVATVIAVDLWAIEREAALPYEAIAIFAVVRLNATMGYVQESHADTRPDQPDGLARVTAVPRSAPSRAS